MRLAASILIVLGSLAAASAVAADAVSTAARDASNAFAGPLTIGGQAKPPPPDEDLASPFVEAHGIEQYLYAGRYLAYYHAIPDNPDAPPPGAPTSPIDAQGRPLWFDGAYGDTMLSTLISRLAFNRQFDDLDRLFDDWSKPAERMADGRRKLALFYDDWAAIFAPGSDWDAAYQLVRDWRSKSPRSRAAALIEALYWYRYAWDARGDGAAATVTDEGWKLFRERLEKGGSGSDREQAVCLEQPVMGIDSAQCRARPGLAEGRSAGDLAGQRGAGPGF